MCSKGFKLVEIFCIGGAITGANSTWRLQADTEYWNKAHHKPIRCQKLPWLYVFLCNDSFINLLWVCLLLWLCFCPLFVFLFIQFYTSTGQSSCQWGSTYQLNKKAWKEKCNSNKLLINIDSTQIAFWRIWLITLTLEGYRWCVFKQKNLSKWAKGQKSIYYSIIIQ